MASSLAADVEYRLREIIEESMKFMRHSHRNKLKVEDVDHALKVKNIEPLWGFSAPEPPQYRKATSTFGNVYFVEEEEIDLTRLLHAPLPPLPREISYTGVSAYSVNLLRKIAECLLLESTLASCRRCSAQHYSEPYSSG